MVNQEIYERALEIAILESRLAKLRSNFSRKLSSLKITPNSEQKITRPNSATRKIVEILNTEPLRLWSARELYPELGGAVIVLRTTVSSLLSRLASRPNPEIKRCGWGKWSSVSYHGEQK